MKCIECGGTTKTRREQNYKYTESGLNNVYLAGINVHSCEKCGTEYPELPAVRLLHDGLVKAILSQREALRGEEVRFLRKEMGIKAKDFAEILGVTKVAVSRWENSSKPLAKITDRLIRCVFQLHRVKRHTPDDIKVSLEAFQSRLSDIDSKKGRSRTDIDVNRELAAAA
jgi:putative zinc finger/helix-turn-helix YgiT family protein